MKLNKLFVLYMLMQTVSSQPPTTKDEEGDNSKASRQAISDSNIDLVDINSEEEDSSNAVTEVESYELVDLQKLK